MIDRGPLSCGTFCSKEVGAGSRRVLDLHRLLCRTRGHLFGGLPRRALGGRDGGSTCYLDISARSRSIPWCWRCAACRRQGHHRRRGTALAGTRRALNSHRTFDGCRAASQCCGGCSGGVGGKPCHGSCHSICPGGHRRLPRRLRTTPYIEGQPAAVAVPAVPVATLRQAA